MNISQSLIFFKDCDYITLWQYESGKDCIYIKTTKSWNIADEWIDAMWFTIITLDWIIMDRLAKNANDSGGQSWEDYIQKEVQTQYDRISNVKILDDCYMNND